MKKILTLLIAVMLTAACASAQGITTGEWIQKYNAAAAKINALTFSLKGVVESYDDANVFLFSEKNWVSVYTGSGDEPEAVIVEVSEEGVDAAAITAAAVVACDEKLDVYMLHLTILEAEEEMVEENGERYVSFGTEGWIFSLLDMSIGDSRYVSYIAIRESAYEDIMGELLPDADDPASESPNDEESDKPEEPDSDETPEAPKKEKENPKVYKI